MIRHEEGYLAFEFGERWQVIKYDAKKGDYKKLSDAVSETKAVDFLAILDEQTLYFLEVKDFRKYRIENKERLSEGELAIEVAQKVRDSVAGIIGFYRTSSHEEWQLHAEMLFNRNKPVKVVLWLEQDLPSYPKDRLKAQASTQANKLKQKLNWLTTKVQVYNEAESELPDLIVKNLPRQS